jgi:hypothetical protein
MSKRIVVLVLATVSLGACAELEKSMNDLNKPQRTPNVSVNLGTKGASGAQPQTDADGGASTAPQPTTAEPVAASPTSAPPTSTQPAAVGATGTCEASCTHYLTCKHVTDPAARPNCIQGCASLHRSPQELAQFQAMDCASAIAAVEHPAPQAGMQATPMGTSGCQAPTVVPRAPDDEKVFQAVTTHAFCGFTYNKTTGTSREMVLRFMPDGLLVHQTKTERSGNTSAGSYGVVTAGGDKYCWKYGSGAMLWSSDGANYTPFVSKVEDNGNGVVFFQTRLGEYKACQ